MSELSWTPDRETPGTFARFSGDYNPVHMDAEHARGAGFGDVIVHGMCVLGAAARAAHVLAGEGSMMREINVRFANPVLPGERLIFSGEIKEKEDSLKVTLKVLLDDDRKVMSPASFVLGSAEGGWPLPKGVDPAPDPKDVPGDPFRFQQAEIDGYKELTAPSAVVGAEGVPPMMALLGMTGALEKAFTDVEPEKPGTWVHLRQSGVFYAPVEVGQELRCRIQGGRTVVRTAKVGAQVTIPFVVERSIDGGLIATGACGLFYAFDKEE